MVLSLICDCIDQVSISPMLCDGVLHYPYLLLLGKSTDSLYLTKEGLEMLQYLKTCPTLSQAIIVKEKMLSI